MLKIGNLILLFLTVSLHAVQVQLALLSPRGNEIAEAIAGHRYRLRVTVTSDVPLHKEPTIGLDQFERAQRSATSTQMNTINGVVSYTKRFEYDVVMPGVGTYTIGPARYTDEQETVESKQLRISVIPASEAGEQEERDSGVTVQILTDKSEYYVQERIRLTVRVEYQQKIVSLQTEQPQAKFLSLISVGQPQQGSFEKNGIQYGYAQWEYEGIARQSGKLLIPSVEARYQAMQEREPDSMMGFLSSFMGPVLVNKKQQSASKEIAIKPLPTTQTVTAVGTAIAYRLSAAVTEVAEGEPVAVTLELFGDCPMHFVRLPLEGLPAELQSYESKRLVSTDAATGLPRLSVEHVVQATQAGNFEIPSQSILIFDPHTKKLKPLHTDALSLVVTPMEIVPVAGGQQVDKRGLWYGSKVRLPLLTSSLFWLLWALLSFFIIWQLIGNVFAHLFFVLKKMLIQKTAWWWCRYRLRVLLRTERFDQIYPLLVHFAVRRLDLNAAFVTADQVYEVLAAHMPPAQAQELVSLAQAVRYADRDVIQRLRAMVQRAFKASIIVLLLMSSTLHGMATLEIGNNFFNKNKTPEAVLNWYTALGQATDTYIQQAALHNLIIAEVPAIDLQPNWFLALRLRAFTLMPFWLWQFILLSFLLAACVISLKKRWIGLILGIALTCLAISLDPALSSEKHKYAIVVADQAALYAGPQETYHVLASIPHLARVVIQRAENDWYLVSWHDQPGWIKQTDLYS